MTRLNLLGQTFFRLRVSGPPIIKKGRSCWPCICDCGNEPIVAGTSLKNGNTKSCGCWNIEVATEKGKRHSFKHGHSGGNRSSGKASPTYRSWTSMVSRCSNPRTTQYSDYGGRGVFVCERWKGPQGFQNFLADMKERPTNKTLDRFPNKAGNYEPGNCRWADPQEQATNRRRYQAIHKFTDEELLQELQKRNL